MPTRAASLSANSWRRFAMVLRSWDVLGDDLGDELFFTAE
jgi:hypothetical protein